MTRFQKLVLFVGCSGVFLNTAGLLLQTNSLGYIAVFIGRMAALLYIMEVDKFRAYYLIPLTLSAINSFANEESLIFFEYLTQSIIYQIAAFRLFSSPYYNKYLPKDNI